MQCVKIIRADCSTEYSTPERCAIWELSNDSDDPAVSVARARVSAGVTTAWHALAGVVERYVILAGEGIVEVGDLAPTKVHAGDVVHIPAGTRQRIRNEGPKDLLFHAVCTPRYTPECYIALED
ncbi:cupin domain-containing protein [Coraliomargarita akajimensis]|uniref:Cupin 2 conserved barrel domain protein n=1 Tax=Coraliomargarita akajimensis (strain DSM 45221 / IAM 15411 / JCM 23193 / KCTC 12865 / 04OKA010-24) TaxID=583355 RepID=D5EHQ9_CORAD|nr:cupin domain-containing protein [Coraliomargarita akajimensis]ADE54100.1 Cupin 2 conserved barrel domain protein [Coraliomargarita akajimensis DSM 45221]